MISSRAYHLLESELARERRERAAEQTRHATELLRLHAVLKRETNRANDRESQLRTVEAEARFNLTRMLNVPLNPREVAELEQARRRPGGTNLPQPFRSISQVVRGQEEESAVKARQQREQQMADDAARFKPNEAAG
jgi:hypothetical protein